MSKQEKGTDGLMKIGEEMPNVRAMEIFSQAPANINEFITRHFVRPHEMPLIVGVYSGRGKMKIVDAKEGPKDVETAIVRHMTEHNVAVEFCLTDQLDKFFVDEVRGHSVFVRYIGDEKNPRTGHTYRKYDCRYSPEVYAIASEATK